MSNEVEMLGNVIEFSIGLAGFSGVVAAFTNRSSWGPIERYRLVNLLIASLIPAFMSFIALGILEAEPVTWNTWHVSSLLFMLCVLGLMYRAFHGRNILPPEDRKLVNPRMFALLNSQLLLVVVLQAVNITGFLGDRPFLGFYSGLIMVLIVGVLLFGVAVLSGSDEPRASVDDR